MINAIIVDDEVAGAEALKKDIALYCPEVKVMALAHSVDDAEAKIKAHAPDLIFLDIEMPRANGFDLLKRLGEIHFEVIFTTAYDEYALKAIKHNAIDYLLKPVDHEELQQAVKKCINKINNQITGHIKIENLASALTQLMKPQRLPVPSSSGILYVDTTDIIRLEGDQNYTNIYLTGSKKITSSKTLKDFELVLNARNFFRIHKTHLINLNHAVKYMKGEGGFVLMTDGSTLEVSRQKKQELLALLAQ